MLFSRMKDKQGSARQVQQQAPHKATEPARRKVIKEVISGFVTGAVSQLNSASRSHVKDVLPQDASIFNERSTRIYFWPPAVSDLVIMYYRRLSDSKDAIEADKAYFFELIEAKRREYPQFNFEITFTKDNPTMPDKLVIKKNT